MLNSIYVYTKALQSMVPFKKVVNWWFQKVLQTAHCASANHHAAWYSDVTFNKKTNNVVSDRIMKSGFMNQSRRRGNTCISLTCSTPISEYEQTDDRTEMAQWCLKPNINQNLGPCSRPRILHSNLLHVIKKIWHIKLEDFF